MKSASVSELTFGKAKESDLKDIIDLLYITEPEPEEEWGLGSEEEMKNTLKRLLKIKNNRFSIQNIIVARKENELVGMALLMEGKDIDRLTKKSEKHVMSYQKGMLNKLEFLYRAIKGKFMLECEEDEFYISNIAIKPEYRGHGYSKIMFKKAFEIAKKRNYKKASLIAKNEKLVKFYQSIGFSLVDEKIRRMVINIG